MSIKIATQGSQARYMFEMWGLDYVCPIKLATQGSQARYSIVATDYLAKWFEARAARMFDSHKIAMFIYEKIITHFGCPIEMVTGQRTHFITEVTSKLLEKFMIIHKRRTMYYPCGNRNVESTNKVLISILTKSCEVKRADWESKHHSTLWAYRATYKMSIGQKPFRLVYGLEAIMPS